MREAPPVDALTGRANAPARPDPAPAPSLPFRADIEGLRAVAVLSILLHHLGVRGFSGGFVGVDIFFVISGYLITTILLRDIHAERSSIALFYRRRILRLFPALFPMLLVTSLGAWFVLAPGELVTYARSLLGTLFFLSNFAFYADTGYFSLNAASRPLLHTWSLAIEEQFYIVWPVFIAALMRRPRGGLVAPIMGLTLLSFALSVWMVSRDMSAAFYLIPFRAWELALGGLLPLLPALPARTPWLRQALAALGLAVILACVNRYHELTTPFPGLFALFPCLGAAALILSGPNSLCGRLLALPPARFFGRISYSLYLWHWPLIVLAHLALLPIHTPWAIAALLTLSVLLATLSHRWCEKGGQRLFGTLSNRALFAAAAGAILLFAAAAGAMLLGHGFPQRYTSEQVRIAAVLNGDEQKSYRSGRCFLVEPGDRFDPAYCLGRAQANARPTLLLVGDSTAAHYWPGFARQAASFTVLQATTAGCRPAITPSPRRPCQSFYNHILRDWLANHHPDAVLLSGRWQPEDMPALDATLAELRRRNQRTILIGPVPNYDAPLARLLFRTPPDQRDAVAALHRDPTLPAIDRAARDAARRHGAAYIAPLDLLCPEGRCRLFAGRDIPLQFDDVHFTRQGSELAVARMMPAISAALSSAAAPRPIPPSRASQR